MDLTLGLFWGEHWLNGVELKNGRRSTRSTNRIDHDVHLHAGWNPLFVKVQPYADTWDFYLAVPARAGWPSRPTGTRHRPCCSASRVRCSRENTRST